jgi:hypothetical protein
LQCFLLGLALQLPTAYAQTATTGVVTITVTDPSSAVVPDAALQLQDLGTNDIRTAATANNGTYTFPNLPFGTYRLTVSKAGFETQVFDSVEVQTSRATAVNAVLEVGATSEKVEVTSGETPLIQTDSSAISDTIDTKQVVNLPVNGRDVFGLAFLIPGWTTASGPNPNNVGGQDGTWDNLPGGALGANMDGVPAQTGRWKSAGFTYGATAISSRLEDVAEMTVQTSQLDLSQGSGQAAMQINMITRRGTNQFHGRLYEDFRNTDLNANSWLNNATGLPRNIIDLNDFGVSVGGPILKNKLFFFGTYAESKQPETNGASTTVLAPSAQQGIFTYQDNNGVTQQLNVLQLAGANGFPSTVHPQIASELQSVNNNLKFGSLTPTSDPNILNLGWQVHGADTHYFPTARIDYNLSDKIRLYGSWNETKETCSTCTPAYFPGGVDPLDVQSNRFRNFTDAFGFDWTPKPTLVNQFHAGFLYTAAFFDTNPTISVDNYGGQFWGYGYPNAPLPGYPRTLISQFFPVFNANDNVTWQHGSQTFTFGGSWYREQDHYWNGPGGYPIVGFGIAGQDPLGAVFTSALANAPTSALNNAENLYAELTGRIDYAQIGVGRPLDPATKTYKPFGQYNLDEAIHAFGLYFQDGWKITPTLTLNYGLRWDFIGDDQDLTGAYSSPASIADLWGTSPVGAYFSPGSMGSVTNPVFDARHHAYNPSYRNPEPAIAIAWNPHSNGGWLGSLMGGDKTVIRTGYSLRTYTEGAQNFWAFASNSGDFFYQQGVLNASTAPGTGNFLPGSLLLGNALPPYLLTPPAYSAINPEANLTFGGSQFWAMNPNIRQPYVESWNFGIQRQLGSSNALEIRYVGNLALHSWVGWNINEVNIFENGFLGEFKNAQKNLAINNANGNPGTFAYNGLPGQQPLPILTAAFGPGGSSNFTNGSFITQLQTGQAGAMANNIASSSAYFCNLVGGNNFSPCVTQGFPGPGAGYPLNFFQPNGFATGQPVNYLDSAGMSSYHGLQVEFRQKPVYGMEFNVNYTWSHSLGDISQRNIQAQSIFGQNSLYFTNRDFRLNYGPSIYDIRHVIHASGTYDLPFGKGRQFLNQSGFANEIFGGWTIGTVITFQTGAPIQLQGGYDTFNQNDGGVVLNGVTTANIQGTAGVYHTGEPWVTFINPLYIGSNGQANPTYITPETTPGVLGFHPWLYGPHWTNVDLSVNKSIPIRESLRLTLQGEFINTFNHPTFGVSSGIGGLGDPNIQDFTFGQVTGGPTGPRIIEIRANIEF